MPSDVTTLIPTFPIAVDNALVKRIDIRVGPDGTGVVDVPTSKGVVEILKVPGTALTIVSALKTHGRGFVIHVSHPSTLPSFMVLVA